MKYTHTFYSHTKQMANGVTVNKIGHGSIRIRNSQSKLKPIDPNIINGIEIKSFKHLNSNSSGYYYNFMLKSNAILIKKRYERKLRTAAPDEARFITDCIRMINTANKMLEQGKEVDVEDINNVKVITLYGIHANHPNNIPHQDDKTF